MTKKSIMVWFYSSIIISHLFTYSSQWTLLNLRTNSSQTWATARSYSADCVSHSVSPKWRGGRKYEQMLLSAKEYSEFKNCCIYIQLHILASSLVQQRRKWWGIKFLLVSTVRVIPRIRTVGQSPRAMCLVGPHASTSQNMHQSSYEGSKIIHNFIEFQFLSHFMLN